MTSKKLPHGWKSFIWEQRMSDVVRVLHVLGSMNRGGQETFIMNVYRNIDRSKVQFDFLINVQEKCDYEDEIISLGGIIYRIPRRFPNYWKHLKAMRKFFRENTQYNVIHQHTNSLTAISTALCAKKVNKSKIIYHCHSSKPDKGIVNQIFDFYYKPKVKEYVTHYFACSELAAENLFGKHIEQSEVKIINNAIDSAKFVYNITVRAQKRKEFGVENKFVIGHVGRFAEAKNHAFLIDVFSQIHKQNDDAVLLLIGDGERRGAIEKQVQSLNLKKSVIFAGTREDIPELLCAMDVFLFPSLWEGMPMALVEAQASGLHCVVADSITKEVDFAGLTEHISLNKSAEYWAGKVLMYTDSYERKNMQDKVEKAGFDINEITWRLESFYLSDRQR